MTSLAAGYVNTKARGGWTRVQGGTLDPRRRSSQELVQPLGGDDVGLLGEHLLDKQGMHLRVRIGAPVGQYIELEVLVSGVTHGREHDSARGDAGQNQGLDARVPQLGAERGGAERAEARLADDDLPRYRAQRFDDLAFRAAVGQPPAPAQGGEGAVALRYGGEVRVLKRDPHMHDGQSGRSRPGQRGLGVSEQDAAVALSDAADRGGLEIHEDQRGLRGIGLWYVFVHEGSSRVCCLAAVGRVKRAGWASRTGIGS